MSNDLTIEQLQHALPKGMKQNASQELVDKVNTLTKDDLVRQAYRDNILSYTSVMMDGRFQIGHYIDAIKYITHKLMGDSNIDAYRKTFPDRYLNFVTKGTDPKDIASYVTSYNKNKLVNLIREQTLIPTHILNADYYQKAINKQVALMGDVNVSPTVQQKAADSLLVNLKPPETAKVEIDINTTQNKDIQELREHTLALAKQQQEMISNKMVSVKAVAEAVLIEGEVEDDGNE